MAAVVRSRDLYRRHLLTSVALGLAAAALPRLPQAEEVSGEMPWAPDAGAPPPRAAPGGWLFFRPEEVAMVEAIADRLIPHDELSIGGKEAGCAVFIDRQLAGNYGRGSVLYLKGPAVKGTPQQGPQWVETPAERYRLGLAALAVYCAAQPGGKAFPSLAPADQDAILQQMETGKLALTGVDAPSLFNLLLQSVREGFFADPIYGGNKGMAGWKMLGFPGARYDFRPYIVAQRGQLLNLAPVSLLDRTAG
jgi:gluconate 2-dehydrogenase gamma chain